MARVAVNPQIVSVPSPQGLPLVKYTAEDSKTWKKGELAYFTSGTITPVAGTGVTNVFGIMAQTQSTSTSSTEVWVLELIEGTRLYMFVMTNGSAATADTAEIGTAYGVEALNNVTYLDTGTANGQFKVVRAGSDAMSLRDSYADMDSAPGLVLVEFQGYVS